MRIQYFVWLVFFASVVMRFHPTIPIIISSYYSYHNVDVEYGCLPHFFPSEETRFPISFCNSMTL